MSIKTNSKLLSATFWSISSEILAKTIGPVVFLILTRILSPKDFGIVSIATTILGFVYIVADLGIGKVLIQENGDSELFNKKINAGFWFNVTIGLIIFLFMFIFSKNIAIIFGEIKSSDVIKCMAVQVLFFSVSSVHIAYRKKILDFKFLFYLRLITVLTPAIISIPIAFAGYGYWAIVFGQIIGSLINTIILWKYSKWKPSIRINFKLLNNVLNKSIWNTIDQVFFWIPIILDTYLISKHYSSSVLGIFSTSKTLFTTAITLSLGAITPVIYSALSEQKDSANFEKYVIKAQKLVFILAGIMGVFVFIFKSNIEKLLFNDNWFGISNVFGLIFILMGFDYFYYVILEALRAKGHFKQIALNTLLSVIITIPILFISISNGLIFYVITRCLTLYLRYPLAFYFSNKLIGISFIHCVKNNINTIYCFISALFLNELLEHTVINIYTQNIFKIIIFIIMIYILYIKENKVFYNIFSKLKTNFM